jgi:tripartite-type tricarboxylate transporter receptor subunit TctC
MVQRPVTLITVVQRPIASFGMIRTGVKIVAACAAVAGPAGAAEPDYPVKPIRFVVANLAGGTSDILARMIGARLTERWKQQVIVDNRPGASGLIGN